MQGKPVCLAVNKCDAPATLARWELELALRLRDLTALHPGRLSVIYTSAIEGEGGGVEDLMGWLTAAAAEQRRRGER
jgi:hypothetical protein